MRRNKRYFRKPEQASGIYAISADAMFIKFGIAADPKSRIYALQNGSPLKLRLLSHLVTSTGGKAQSLEKQVHAALARYHAHGEWFYSCPKTIAVAEAMNLGLEEFERRLAGWSVSEFKDAVMAVKSPMTCSLGRFR